MTKKTTTARRSSTARGTAANGLSSHDLRQRKVRRVRAAIRSKSYENSLKLAVGVDRLLDHLLGKS
jgi:hypothetical protein